MLAVTSPTATGWNYEQRRLWGLVMPKFPTFALPTTSSAKLPETAGLSAFSPQDQRPRHSQASLPPSSTRGTYGCAMVKTWNMGSGHPPSYIGNSYHSV